MDRYHVIPYSVEAVQVDMMNLHDIADWAHARAQVQISARGTNAWVEGAGRAWIAGLGSWVVKDPSGQIMVVDDATFHRTFTADSSFGPLRIPVTIEIKE